MLYESPSVITHYFYCMLLMRWDSLNTVVAFFHKVWNKTVKSSRNVEGTENLKILVWPLSWCNLAFQSPINTVKKLTKLNITPFRRLSCIILCCCLILCFHTALQKIDLETLQSAMTATHIFFILHPKHSANVIFISSSSCVLIFQRLKACYLESVIYFPFPKHTE